MLVTDGSDPDWADPRIALTNPCQELPVLWTATTSWWDTAPSPNTSRNASPTRRCCPPDQRPALARA